MSRARDSERASRDFAHAQCLDTVSVENKLSSLITPVVALECTHRSFHMNGNTLRFHRLAFLVLDAFRRSLLVKLAVECIHSLVNLRQNYLDKGSEINWQISAVH